MPGRTTVGQNSGGSVWPQSRISQDGNRRVEPSRNIMYQSGCEPDDTCAGLYGPEQPDRVDLGQAAERGADAEDDEEEAAGLGRVEREDPLAATRSPRVRPWPGNWVCFCRTTRARWAPISAGEDRRDQQHVGDVEPADDDVARERPAEDQERHPGADDRDRQHDRVGDPQAGAGEQVVGQRVAGEALDDAEPDQAEADEPVELTRLAERAGEEHPEHVDQHRREEQQRRPVVDLPDDQAAADVEA